MRSPLTIIGILVLAALAALAPAWADGIGAQPLVAPVPAQEELAVRHPFGILEESACEAPIPIGAQLLSSDRPKTPIFSMDEAFDPNWWMNNYTIHLNAPAREITIQYVAHSQSLTNTRPNYVNSILFDKNHNPMINFWDYYPSQSTWGTPIPGYWRFVHGYFARPIPKGDYTLQICRGSGDWRNYLSWLKVSIR